jgi:hypothetical protein
MLRLQLHDVKVAIDAKVAVSCQLQGGEATGAKVATA